MSFLVNTAHRSECIELMDDFSLKGDVLRDTLDKLAMINKWLGGNRVTIHGLGQLLEGQDKSSVYTIIDLGCGSGDMLREVAVIGRREGFNFKLIGLDANADTLDYARHLSRQYPEISYLHCDVFSETFEGLDFDIVLCSLFLHHFNQSQLTAFLPKLVQKTRLGILVNDLHRHPVAYNLFRLVSLFISNKMVKEDGRISVLRGFKKSELEYLANRIGARSTIKWMWAFRYQWIINKKI